MVMGSILSLGTNSIGLKTALIVPDANHWKKNDLWREEALTQSINCFNLSKRLCWAEWKRWKRKVFGLSEKAKGCVGLSEKEKFFLPEWKSKMLSLAEWKTKGCVKLSEKGKGCVEMSGKSQYCIVIFILIWMRYECWFFRLHLLTVCQEVPVDNIVLAPQLLGQLTSLVYLALQQTKEEKYHSCNNVDHVATRYPRTMQTEVRPSLICGPRPIGQKSPEERERHQFSVQSTPDRLIHPPPNFLSSRKRRHLS